VNAESQPWSGRTATTPNFGWAFDRWPEQFHGHHNLDARNRLDLLEQSQGQRIEKAQIAVNQQHIGAGLANELLDTSFQTLEHTEQRKSNADLEKDQDGASGFTPDAGPDEGQKLHAVAGTRYQPDLMSR